MTDCNNEKHIEDEGNNNWILEFLREHDRCEQISCLIEEIFESCNLNHADEQVEVYLQLILEAYQEYECFDLWDLDLNSFEDYRTYYQVLEGRIHYKNFPYKYFFNQSLNNAAIYLAYARLKKNNIDFSKFDIHVIAYVADIRQYEDKIETLEHAVNYTVKIYKKGDLNTPKGFYKLMPEYAEEKINL